YHDFQGGHVTVGGMIYQGDSFPPRFRGRYVAGDLLGHTVDWHDLETCGSSFKAARGESLLIANDTWFAPTDLTIGPDGAVYVSDWCDKRTAHPDPDADWDRTNGRVYRITWSRRLRSADATIAGGVPERPHSGPYPLTSDPAD